MLNIAIVRSEHEQVEGPGDMMITCGKSRERVLCSTICAPVSMVFVAADIRRREDSRAAPPRPPPLT